jgi:hypothetical protein
MTMHHLFSAKANLRSGADATTSFFVPYGRFYEDLG